MSSCSEKNQCIKVYGVADMFQVELWEVARREGSKEVVDVRR